MTKKITIEPVTRIEGHAKITLQLDDSGQVTDARFHVVEFRGFEKFVEGRPFSEMPTLTSRICGICPVSHHLAAAKACDALAGAQPPRPATLLRRLMHKGQVIQSHALSFFHLSSPDFLLGFDAPPAKRNILGLVAEKPQIARRGIALRKFGQEIIEAVGGRKIHPDVCVAGGMSRSLARDARDRLRKGFDEAVGHAEAGLALFKEYAAKQREEVDHFASFPSKYLGMVDEKGRLEMYDGLIRIVDENGRPLEAFWDTSAYLGLIGEVTEDWSYLKFPFYRPQGYPEGSYRVGPLVRLNVAEGIPTPRAAAEWEVFRDLGRGRPVAGSMYYHWARLVEILFSLERAAELLDDPEITSTDLLTPSSEVLPEGIGVIEAPRGTLIHHYWANPDGSIQKANLIVATGHNNHAMNQAILAVAQRYVDGTKLQEGMLNRVEAAIRCYDPCLSCSTHAIGQMPMIVELCGPDGALVDRVARGERMNAAGTLVIAWGNPGRKDDGAAWVVAERLRAAFGESDAVAVHVFCQLAPELAEMASGAERVLFIDADVAPDGPPVRLEPIAPTAAAGIFNHHVPPAPLLALAQSLYGRAPAAGLLTIRAHDLSFGNTLSEATTQLIDEATARAVEWLGGVSRDVPRRRDAVIRTW